MKLMGKEILRRGGKFVLSDDSHGVAQVGLNYHRLFEYMRSLGISHYHYVAVDKDAGAYFTSLQFASDT
jgi:histidinol-phosphatase (PHP family)